MNLRKIQDIKKKEGEGNMKTEEVKEIKTIGENVGFERIRRITGYLVGTVERFNNGKRAEERDRVKHGTEELFNEA